QRVMKSISSFSLYSSLSNLKISAAEQRNRCAPPRPVRGWAKLLMERWFAEFVGALATATAGEAASACCAMQGKGSFQEPDGR
uniref:Uncharacterized protein n=1 Tax=Aegilops tauschii subsp. strangulata TaxID=200361 RepID=A0A453IES7_AEGTS